MQTAHRSRTRLPNFLIVGAAKCGTTSLYHYLRQHPDIYLSPVKEPRFLTRGFLSFPLRGPADDRANLAVQSLEDYEALFSEATTETAIGEASPDTLYYAQQSIPRIRELLGDPRIVIVLRNPVDRAWSNYQHLCKGGRESLPFREVWDQSEERIGRNWSFMWDLKGIGLYAEQVRAFQDAFSRVTTILSDDLQEHPGPTLRSLYQFLDVDPDFETDTGTRFNRSGIPKSQLLNKAIIRRYPGKGVLRFIAYKLTPRFINKTLVDRIKEQNLVRHTLPDEDRRLLEDIYRDDVARLGRLIGRDLSHWIPPHPTS